MNIKLMSVAAALAVSAAVAQDYDDEDSYESTTEETTEETAPAIVPTYEEKAPVAKATPTQSAPAQGFGVLHGNAYNTVGSEAGAATIGGDMNAVYKMYGRSLAYVEPTNKNAVLSMHRSSMTYLLGFNAGDPSVFTAGVALANMGFAFDLGLDKMWTTEENGPTTTETSTTGAGDLINIKFGMNLGALDLTMNAFWLTFEEEVDTEVSGAGASSEEDNDKWNIGVNVNVSNGPSAKTLCWSAGLNFLRHKDYREVTNGNTSVETTNPGAYTLINPYFNFALPVLSSANAQVLLGTNTRLPIYIFDEIKDGNTTNNKSEFGLYTSPNILGELSLNENWIVFAGATYEWQLFDRVGETIEGDDTDDNSIMSMKTYGTSANAGARFQYNNFILEASIAEDLNSSSWSGLVGNFGAFITF